MAPLTAEQQFKLRAKKALETGDASFKPRGEANKAMFENMKEELDKKAKEINVHTSSVGDRIVKEITPLVALFSGGDSTNPQDRINARLLQNAANNKANKADRELLREQKAAAKAKAKAKGKAKAKAKAEEPSAKRAKTSSSSSYSSSSSSSDVSPGVEEVNKDGDATPMHEEVCKEKDATQMIEEVEDENQTKDDQKTLEGSETKKEYDAPPPVASTAAEPPVASTAAEHPVASTAAEPPAPARSYSFKVDDTNICGKCPTFKLECLEQLMFADTVTDISYELSKRLECLPPCTEEEAIKKITDDVNRQLHGRTAIRAYPIMHDNYHCVLVGVRRGQSEQRAMLLRLVKA
jgi:hypothetical protein